MRVVSEDPTSIFWFFSLFHIFFFGSEGPLPRKLSFRGNLCYLGDPAWARPLWASPMLPTGAWPCTVWLRPYFFIMVWFPADCPLNLCSRILHLLLEWDYFFFFSFLLSVFPSIFFSKTFVPFSFPLSAPKGLLSGQSFFFLF